MAPRERQRLQPRTPIQSGGPGGEFGGSQRLYTGRNPFMTPNDPGMDFGAPPSGRPDYPPKPRHEWPRGEGPYPMPMPRETRPEPYPMPMPRVPRKVPDWYYDRIKPKIEDWFGGPEEGVPNYPNPRMPLPDDEPFPRVPDPRMPWPRDEMPYMQPAGLSQTWKNILERTGNEDLANEWLEGQQMAEMGGYGYNPAPKSYDDYYTGQDIIDMEVLPGVGYEPGDEYDFDKKRGYENRIWGSDPRYAARGGIMSLRR